MTQPIVQSEIANTSDFKIRFMKNRNLDDEIAL